MKLTTYVSIEEALEMHRVLIERYGGAEGVRDLGMLESALMRPRSGYYETLSAQAACLLQGLATNHPFVDGNKRVAFAVALVFLDANGFELHVSASVAERFLIERVIKKRIDVHAIAKWLEKYMVAR